MVDSNDTRVALTSRVIPEMTFSDGSAASMTGPPPPMPHYLTAEGRAMKRFAIEGNAVCMSEIFFLSVSSRRFPSSKHGASKERSRPNGNAQGQISPLHAPCIWTLAPLAIEDIVIMPFPFLLPK